MRAEGSPTLIISELFYSIQGESSYAGLPCVFIRLTGCNLRCNYCDSRYTFDEPGAEYGLNEVLQFAEKYPQALVEITGGEPLLQDNVLPLMQKLLKAGRTVLLETNGSLDISRVPDTVIKIVDLKCPGSGMDAQVLYANLTHLNKNDEIKFVLSSRNDYDWAVNSIKRYKLETVIKLGNLLFSPITARLDPEQLSEWMLADNLQVRLQLQLHKIIWPACDRGV